MEELVDESFKYVGDEIVSDETSPMDWIILSNSPMLRTSLHITRHYKLVHVSSILYLVTEVETETRQTIDKENWTRWLHDSNQSR